MSNLNLTDTSLFISMLYLSLIANVFAAQSIDKKLSIGNDVQLQIKVQRGDVTIQTWDKNEVSVSGTLDELSEGFIFEQQENNLNIEDKMPRHYNSGSNTSSQLTIKVPQAVKLSVDTVSANLQLTGIKGELELNTVSGNISAKAVDGKIQFETVSGMLQDTDSQGEISYHLVSGDLTSQSRAEKVTIEQVSGEVNANLSVAKEVTLKTVSGDVQISLAKNLTKANLESVSGDIMLTFVDMPDASFDLNGGPSGKINNALTQDKPEKQKYAPRAELAFQTGSGAAKVKVNTVSGELTLKKR
ncbi:DUF4097 domain-containing protein [Shewanella glacialipiscicola]|uniref:DUF4097 family beta strand repeat-containing protein n=1 Tax=Shewanella glacialipiscicola TaxID=614069 RepID=UPI0021D8F054|nr:DUF4097 domain-containing protein [Shewanella glacialipiscicola]MCU7993685.1 DUF4097 domain-containing protein [Shewanella glacialipiscicola]MCU8025003.1 DUF4097 domain-containing protein [Shewanella glacialipiscicola]